MACEVAGKVLKTMQLGRGEHRRDPDVLSATGRAPQAYEVDEHARTAQRRDQTANPGRADLPQRSKLSSSGARAGRGGARELDRSHTLSEHGAAGRAQEA